MGNLDVSIVQIIQILGYVVATTIFIVMIKADIRIIRVQMSGITENLKVLNSSLGKLSDILTKVAVQDTRIGGIEEDIRELKHGKGFVSLNGEWPRKKDNG